MWSGAWAAGQAGPAVAGLPSRTEPEGGGWGLGSASGALLGGSARWLWPAHTPLPRLWMEVTGTPAGPHPTCSAGQGGKQSAKDASGKFARSAGSRLRRYNEAALQRDVAGGRARWAAGVQAQGCKPAGTQASRGAGTHPPSGPPPITGLHALARLPLALLAAHRPRVNRPPPRAPPCRGAERVA